MFIEFEDKTVNSLPAVNSFSQAENILQFNINFISNASLIFPIESNHLFLMYIQVIKNINFKTQHTHTQWFLTT